MTDRYLNQIHCKDFLASGALLRDRKFDVVIADPPYNIGKDFGNGTDSRPLAEYIEWTKAWLALCFDHLAGQRSDEDL